ncbi:MAG: hypothetical protein OXO49_04940 [Gammaproteobacteria bacterium]|nr:hypothetical protein [Gammaproteobacteria bacterium]MDE0252333.1 hypothetical protein [Gammaproteobacteria bacterium]MDE0402558.1 hypothetical protein [Gammaproteobacteria bacterium]
MLESITRIKHIAFSEIRTFRRLTRFWVAIVVLSFACVVPYIFSAFSYIFLAPYSQSMGATTPFYLLSYIDPTYFLFFQLVTLFLLFDSQHRLVRSRLQESLNSKPPKTFEYLMGRVLGISFLLWMFIAGILILMYLVGLVSIISGLEFSDVFQIHSMINLLIIDVPVMLVFWASWTVFLSTVLRSRVLVLIVGLSTMLVWFYLTQQLPFSLHSLVTPSSNDTLFVSDILPQFVSFTTVCVRLATLIFACGLILLASSLSGRTETEKNVTKYSFSYGFLLLGSLVFVLAVVSTLARHNLVSTWQLAHEQSSWDHELDILGVAGKIEIDPGKEFVADLTYEFQVMDSNLSDELAFSLNAGLTVEHVALNGITVDHTLNDGLLLITLLEPLNVAETHALQVVYRGKPDPRFAYLDAVYDYEHDRLIPPDTVKFLGTRGTVFEAGYIALMPGAYWYPQPGSIKNSAKPLALERDLFQVNLDVTLKARKWKLITTSDTDEISPGKYKVMSNIDVPEIGILASNFESVSTDIAGMTFEIVTHKRHGRNLGLFDSLGDSRREALEELIQQELLNGLTLPDQSLSFVEIPRQLRTVGGGWRMPSTQSLPGLILMKEHGFPRANLQRNFTRIDDEFNDDFTESERARYEINSLRAFFDHFSVGTDSLKTNLVLQSWKHFTSARGENAALIDNVIQHLIGSLTSSGFYMFSVHSATRIAPQLSIHSDTASKRPAQRGIGNWILQDVVQNERNFQSRITNIVLYEKISLGNIPSNYGNRFDLEHLMYKSSEIATGLTILHDNTVLTEWIAEMQEDFRGRTYTFEELKQHAEQHEVLIEPFLTEWIESGNAPGYITSDATTIRIADDENNQPRYQTSVHLCNEEPTSGVVAFRQVYTTGMWNWGNPIIVVLRDSCVQVNMITEDELSELWMIPYYSMNQLQVQIDVHTNSEDFSHLQPGPTTEDTSWSPELHEGIIVDNLDSGFSIPNQRVSENSLRKLGPSFWFSNLLGSELDLFKNMIVVDLSQNLWSEQPNKHWYLLRTPWWYRTAYQYNPYGKYEKNHVQARANSTRDRARFSVDIPEPGVWNLEYHWPWGPDRTNDLFGDATWELKVYIQSDGSLFETKVDMQTLTSGWVNLGTFELAAGETVVEVSPEVINRTKFRGRIYADAIRWLRDSTE